ncbi:PCI-domain-containing protein [Testicularia cyperi]|uniref:Eukaryotic translation initiation factor 3 subunit M n=1 Tax=Testicularia cyperi TaxID=1882483 RepID=A0A317XYL8_9BASI|nr:PCI-domain-containing protein [Testicularia cyperi]
MSADLVTVLADGTFEEQVVEVSAFLSRSQPEAAQNDFITKFQKLALEAEPAPASEDAEAAPAAGDAAKKQQVVQQLVSEVKSLGEGSDRELEGVYNLLASLISANFSVDESQPLFRSLVAAITKDGASDKNLVRYRILSNLFNTLPASSPLRLDLFNALLTAASANDDLDYLSSALHALPQWLAQWNVDESAKAQCLESVAKALGNAEKEHEQSSKAYQFLLLHLRYISTTASSSSSTKESAERTVASALRLPKLYEFEDLLQVKAVTDLNGTPVFELLKIFVGGNAKEFQAWSSSNSAEISRLGLNQEQLLMKIRLLDLADLCAQSVSSDVSYDSIAKTLDISTDDVETWVIDVIRAGLVSGKLSQVKGTFRVYKSVNRQFGKQQWEQLESRLVQWQKSIASIIDSIAATRGGRSSTAAADNAVAQTEATA